MKGLLDITADATGLAVAKGVATAGASAGLLGLNSWAWAAAIVGSFFSLYLEGARKPEDIVRTIVEILGWAFAAALFALALPFVPWFGIGAFAEKVPLGARAGILGLSIRWVVITGKAVLAQKAKGWSEK